MQHSCYQASGLGRRSRTRFPGISAVSAQNCTNAIDSVRAYIKLVRRFFKLAYSLSSKDSHMSAFDTLTERQLHVYDFIRDKIVNRGYGPTVREIGENFDI